jgi:prophage regulatory protein
MSTTTLQNQASTPSLLRLPQVKARTGLSRSAIYARVAQNDFPEPVQIGPRSVAWLDSEISEWIAARVRLSPTARAAKSPHRASADPGSANSCR